MKKVFIKLRSVKVTGRNFTAFYCHPETDQKIEVEGEFKVFFFPGDAPEIEIETLEAFVHQCKSCDNIETKKLEPTDFNTYELACDITNQIDMDDYEEY